MDGLTTWTVVVYIAFGIIFVGLTGSIVYFSGRKVLRLFTRPNENFGLDIKPRLIGLLVAAFFFPEASRGLFATFLQISKNLVAGAKSLIEGLNSALRANCYQVDTEGNCVVSAASNLVAAIGGILQQIIETLATLPVNRVIAFFAIWAFVSYMLDTNRESDENARGGFRTISYLYSIRQQPIVQNAIFFVLLAFSSYLGMAAILAIPELEEKGIVYQEVSIEKLKIQLANSATNLEPFQSKFEIPVMNEVTSKINAFIPTAVAPITPAKTTTTPQSVPPSLQSLQTPILAPTATPNPANEKQPVLTEEQLEELKRWNVVNRDRTDDLLSRYTSFVEKAKNQQVSEQSSVLTNYEAGSLISKGNKERVKYFFMVSQWASEQSALRAQYVSDCRGAIKQIGESWQRLSYVVSRSTSSFTEISDQQILLADDIYRASQGCNYSEDDSKSLASGQMPEWLKLGEASDLGPFHFFASWLLKTESLSFALITGLLGFGLLGSACSTFIREKAVRTAGGTQPGARKTLNDSILVHDLTEVVVRGVAAAVVVFMAMRGGLAIFSSGNGQPNSYVLLLTCLVAAVFSEAIWGRVHQELLRRLNNGNDSGEPDPANDPSNPLPLPVIEPSTSPVAGGGTAKVTGIEFKTIKSVTFGGIISPDPVVSEPSVITVLIPAHEPGKVDVLVEGDEGELAVLPFEYVGD
jgi:hypothetical protein